MTGGRQLWMMMFSTLLLAFLGLGADQITCTPVEPEEPVCAAPSDCEGMPHILCVGAWTCVEGQCAWECDAPEPIDEQTLCSQTGGSWSECGSGCGPWACGTPLHEICPAVCVPQCVCPDEAPGWAPDAGCVACDCAEWTQTWQALVAQVKQCTTADECVALPGTSCGCTRNLVVNGDSWLDPLWNLADQMGAAGCGPFMSPCDCPPADGFVCEDGQCQWNYLTD